MKKNNTDNVYSALIGMTKKQVVETLGEGYNYYPDDLWIYEICKTWWGKKSVLLLNFNKENILEKTDIKNYFFELEL
ncbi:hypothetical protein HZQ28_17465 [Elizabethkingia anophelis]|uniref:hypothetical protein n=1 Tax=Elizabethkingia anophelis TaxID=1117645 RepID=UPI001365F52D|nr:hypothetical protein [Elizabethkingia anophelis]MCT3946661.1 hypothetical protein [Elizabethkingia anophelis]MCT3996275.1 hypothetical protein [Elizabethkingia anophelis]MCT3999930.1 hypothetical protein [Elizabethkingia anophelis]MCT4256519.1 hypothetical protein [Elizabethkingia anophelis]MDV3876153.1 hypothetical protein [Elizabethkingia anophelis]